jgi:hypothetical protein
MGADWENIGIPRWYDCKLGRMKDRRLARLVGTSLNRIRYRRELFGIAPYSVHEAIEPYRHLLGVETDSHISRLCDVSVSSVTNYRESLCIPPRPRAPQRKQRIPANHPVRPYKALLGLVADKEIAKLAGVPVATVEALREAFGFQPVAPLPKAPKRRLIPDYHGPLLGYESLFGTMSAAKISRATGVAITVVERRQTFLGVTPYVRVSRLERYRHLVGVVSSSVLAKLAGVSPARVRDFARAKRG